VKLHLDIDVGSDTDDLCALAMLLGWPGVELTGVTTNTDPGGRRAGYAEYALLLAGREDVRVAAGAEGTLAPTMVPLAFPEYWPEPTPARPGPPGRAIDLLAASAEAGATTVAIGPYTNLAIVESERPGLLRSAGVVVMGGHVPPSRPGYPPSGVHEDFNVQQDRFAAAVVLTACAPVIVPVSRTIEVGLRRAHLPRLRAAGPLGALLADQAVARARDHGFDELALAYPKLPDDVLNFQHDALACAVAVGWPGVGVEEIPIRVELRDDRAWMTRAEGEPTLRVVTEVDAARFEVDWLAAVERASALTP
jgi:purine nucleosidase